MMTSKESPKLEVLLLAKPSTAATPLVKNFTPLLETCGLKSKIISTLPEEKSLQHFNMLFIDVSGQSWGGKIPKEIADVTKNIRVVLFNVPCDTLCEKQLLLTGIDGVFYLADRPDIVLRGLIQLQKGERWFKRETMNEAISELLQGVSSSNKQELPNACFTNLTRRENAIIKLVSLGAKNQEIADQLHISPNTVKTHLYSIFRKTDSRNRVELITLSQQVSSN
ncbi:response regulator transcription factor [Psychrosphaera sp.]|nr:response regulator transcription factor [Psychrosphaera sp.]